RLLLGRRGRPRRAARTFGPDLGQIGRSVGGVVIPVGLWRQRRHLPLRLPEAPIVRPHRLQFIATILHRPPPSFHLGSAFTDGVQHRGNHGLSLIPFYDCGPHIEPRFGRRSDRDRHHHGLSPNQ